MGCNCGSKKSPPPAGISRPSAPPPPSQVNGRGPVMQSAGQGRQKFALKLPDGRRLEYGSKLEAEASRARRGYSGTVVPI